MENKKKNHITVYYHIFLIIREKIQYSKDMILLINSPNLFL